VSTMKTYVILRRNGWRTAEELQAAGERSLAVGDDMSQDIRWIRSYAIEQAGGLGTVCIYEATDEDAIRRHADTAGLPATEIIPVADTIIIRPDPEPAQAGA
jgi:Protein of unknown function (DUF4242)